MSESEFDFIVIGGGSAGCAVAARLADAGIGRVLVIEAGGSDRHPYTRVPAATGLAIFSPRFNWMYQAEPDASRAGRVDMWPAGRVLGGGSAINGMMFVRGHRYDYDRWAALGCSGWDYASVLPYFRRLEHNERGADAWRGRDGPVWVSDSRAPHPLVDAWIAAAVETGIARNPDLNGESQEGVDRVQISQQNGWRHATSTAYLWPRVRRGAVTLELRAFVTRIGIERGRATVVEFFQGGRQHSVRARAGICISAGAIAAPKLLMLSGVGSGAELQRFGIAVVRDAPQVGANLQEHPGVRWEADVNIPTLNADTGLIRNICHGLNFLAHGEGPLTIAVGQAQALVRTRSDLPAPNVQIIMSPFQVELTAAGPRLTRAWRVGGAIGVMRPESRGRIRLRGADPHAPPVIEHQLLGSAADRDQLIEGAQCLQRILEAPAFRRHVRAVRAPNPALQSTEEWQDFVRDTAFLMYHPVGTCRMGADEDSVLDPRLRVRGVDRLWVADASIMPTLPAGNTNATAIMIGERAADLIQSDLRAGAGAA